ncbi:hypothetical protein HC766_07130 [Candidatus Gracilibacteria bacterium]|nr:hypothetical protein [Candidatus Gracilibacteria bacterium]
MKKILAEARVFHEKIVRYREQYLRVEIVSRRNKIKVEEEKFIKADKRKSEVMAILLANKSRSRS